MKTEHGALRHRVRAMDDETLEVVLGYGRQYHRSGVIHVTVVDRDVVDELSAEQRSKVCGWVVLLDKEDGRIITVYRSRGAHHEILKQPPYRRSGAAAA